MSSNQSDSRGGIEAALYAAGRPLSSEDLAKAAGITSKREAARLARELAEVTKANLKAIEIAELPGERFVMQLRPGFDSVARRFATKALVSSAALRTLSYILSFQPITALELANRRGPRIYQHLKILREADLVSAKPAGRTKLYQTTTVFAEYFGLNPDPAAMKQQLSKLGRLKIPGSLTQN